VKGLGPKKVRQLWQELGCESLLELKYACNENRLLKLKGFGEKTQLQVLESLEFRLSATNKFHFASIDHPLNQLLEVIRKSDPALLIAPVGEVARKNEIIESVHVLVSGQLHADLSDFEKQLPLPVTYTYCLPQDFHKKRVELSATTEHLQEAGFYELPPAHFPSENEVYRALNIQYIEPELREGRGEVELARRNAIPELIRFEDLAGVLHNHTTYSDGAHSLREMAEYCRQSGYRYLGICDHSRSAGYANGLSIDRVMQQQNEIDALNQEFSDFAVLKGIESDILTDGSLDYPDDILKTFDFVVASVHSNLNMNEEKATARLLHAIENPYTSILGHPSGRLLLARRGYPLDYKKIIDACAGNGVSIELNAHPYRLDIDWRWIPYCLEKGVKISINPDAHYKEGFRDMYYGVCAARKGMLSREFCLNTLSLADLLKVFARTS